MISVNKFYKKLKNKKLKVRHKMAKYKKFLPKNHEQRQALHDMAGMTGVIIKDHVIPSIIKKAAG